jgi:hypothetical protein
MIAPHEDGDREREYGKEEQPEDREAVADRDTSRSFRRAGLLGLASDVRTPSSGVPGARTIDARLRVARRRRRGVTPRSGPSLGSVDLLAEWRIPSADVVYLGARQTAPGTSIRSA